ncbi:MAG: porin family protein [Holophaga sp.]|nr:porin family protein [Holophaga sp.]
MKLLAFSTLILCAASLSAADFTGGVQLGPAFPLGDMKSLADGNAGAQLVLFGRWDLGGGHAIRARLDGTSAKGTPGSFDTPFGKVANSARVEATASLGTLGADYLYHFDGTPDHGVYAGGGLAYGNNHVELGLPTTAGRAVRGSESVGALAYGLYAGYQFNPHWSVELTYRASTFKKDLTFGDSTGTFKYSMPAVALVAGYTF